VVVDAPLPLARAEYPDIRDLGDRTVGIGHVYARGTASEVEIGSPHARVPEDALDAVELRE
jgi:hypothetical protein